MQNGWAMSVLIVCDVLTGMGLLGMIGVGSIGILIERFYLLIYLLASSPLGFDFPPKARRGRDGVFGRVRILNERERKQTHTQENGESERIVNAVLR